MSRAERVFDASAALAILFGEPGAERASELLPADISAVNAAEVLAKLIQKGIPQEAAITALEALSLAIVPFGADECELSTEFVYPQLSLGDRSCLATAYKQSADAWASGPRDMNQSPNQEQPINGTYINNEDPKK